MNILNLFSGIIKPVFDGIFQWKSEDNKMEISRQDFELMKKDLQANIEIRMAEELRKPESEFRDFMLKYEGSAAEQTPFMRNLRSSVRPFITYWSLIIISIIMFGWVDSTELSARLESIPEPLWQIFLTVFGFWFGGRALMQVAESWKGGEVKKQEAVSQGKVAEERVKVERIHAQIQMNEAKKTRKEPEDNEDGFWGE